MSGEGNETVENLALDDGIVKKLSKKIKAFVQKLVSTESKKQSNTSRKHSNIEIHSKGINTKSSRKEAERNNNIMKQEKIDQQEYLSEMRELCNEYTRIRSTLSLQDQKKIEKALQQSIFEMANIYGRIPLMARYSYQLQKKQIIKPDGKVSVDIISTFNDNLSIYKQQKEVQSLQQQAIEGHINLLNQYIEDQEQKLYQSSEVRSYGAGLHITPFYSLEKKEIRPTDPVYLFLDKLGFSIPNVNGIYTLTAQLVKNAFNQARFQASFEQQYKSLKTYITNGGPSDAVAILYDGMVQRYNSRDNAKVPTLSIEQKKLFYICLGLGDGRVPSGICKELKQKSELLIRSKFPALSITTLRTDVPNNQDILDIIARVASNRLTKIEKDYLDPLEVQAQMRTRLSQQIQYDPSDVQTSKIQENDPIVQKLLYKESSDKRFGDMYGFLIDRAKKSNIDITSMYTDITTNINQAKAKVASFETIVTSTIFPQSILLQGHRMMAPLSLKSKDEQQFFEWCTLYTLDYLLGIYKLHNNHRIASKLQQQVPHYCQEIPDQTPGKKSKWLELRHDMIQRDQEIYMTSLQEVMKPRPEELVLDKQKLSKTLKESKFSILQHTLSSVGTIQQFQQKSGNALVVLERKMARGTITPEESKLFLAWIQLLQQSPEFIMQSAESLQLKTLLTKNKDAIQRYQKFLGVMKLPEVELHTNAQRRMQTMLNGIFANTNNFGALKSICPMLAKDMEQKERTQAKLQSDHSKFLLAYPMLGSLNEYGRGLWNGSGAALADIFLSSRLLLRNVLCHDAGSVQYVNHQFLLEYYEQKNTASANVYTQDQESISYKLGNATGSVVLSVLMSSLVGGLGGSVISAGLREFISGAIMAGPTAFSGSLTKQVQQHGLHVDFRQAYAYSVSNLVSGGVSSMVNKVTFGNLGDGPGLLATLRGFSIMRREVGLKTALKLSCMQLFKDQAVGEGLQEVTDDLFQVVVDFLFSKMTDTQYFEGLSLKDLLETFLYTFTGMKKLSLGKKGLGYRKNILRDRMQQLQQYMIDNKEKYNDMPNIDKVTTALDTHTAQEIQRYKTRLEQYLQDRYGSRRVEIYAQVQHQTFEDARGKDGLNHSPLTEEEKKVIWDAKLYGFGELGEDGKPIGRSGGAYKEYQIYKKTMILARCESVDEEGRRNLIRNVCTDWKAIVFKEKEYHSLQDITLDDILDYDYEYILLMFQQMKQEKKSPGRYHIQDKNPQLVQDIKDDNKNPESQRRKLAEKIWFEGGSGAFTQTQWEQLYTIHLTQQPPTKDALNTWKQKEIIKVLNVRSAESLQKVRLMMELGIFAQNNYPDKDTNNANNNFDMSKIKHTLEALKTHNIDVLSTLIEIKKFSDNLIDKISPLKTISEIDGDFLGFDCNNSIFGDELNFQIFVFDQKENGFIDDHEVAHFRFGTSRLVNFFIDLKKPNISMQDLPRVLFHEMIEAYFVHLDDNIMKQEHHDIALELETFFFGVR